MKFVNKGQVSDMGETAFEAPCAKCGQQIPVSKFTAEVGAMANRICKQKGWAPITRREIALCPPCYEKHRQALHSKAAVESSMGEDAWQLVVTQWPQSNQQRRWELEREFRKTFPWLGGRLANWLEKQNSGKRSSTDDAAGF